MVKKEETEPPCLKTRPTYFIEKTFSLLAKYNLKINLNHFMMVKSGKTIFQQNK